LPHNIGALWCDSIQQRDELDGRARGVEG
jgi:hypothetical protein